jgi:hypothetical protein
MPEEHRVEPNKTHSGILYPPEKGGGIIVEIEAMHQLHCLNLMRKVIYADYYSRPENVPVEFMVSDKMFFNHIDHCVDNLRQFIMCKADMTPVPCTIRTQSSWRARKPGRGSSPSRRYTFPTRSIWAPSWGWR